MKLFLTAGHSIINGKGTGVHGWNGFDEAVWARILVNDILTHMKYANWVHESKLFTDHDSWSLGAVINWIARQATSKCIVAEIHFNAHHNTSATGCEVLVANDHTFIEKTHAENISRIMSDTLGLRNRGVKTEAQSGRKKLGFLSGNSKHAVNLIIEICFCSNKYDVHAFREHYLELIENLSDYFTKCLQEA